MEDLKDFQNLLNKIAKELPDDILTIMRVEGKNFIKHNFKQQGFDTGTGVDKWKKRTTLDKRGRNITRYRTNRVGKKGTPNKYGRNITGRGVLIGHDTGGNKLANSFRGKVNKQNQTVRFRTYKEYAQRHNEGLDGMPKRQFIGDSKYLTRRIHKKVKRVLDKRQK